ncbi:MAG: GNAT family N-acetyltransferase [Clostridiales bacterium]|nr:GNAT family N-acetyltransferase [Clostridiales bacterium]
MDGYTMNLAGNRLIRQRQSGTQIRRITRENAGRFAPYLSGRSLGDPETIAFGAEQYGEPCGAIELRISGGAYLELGSIVVDERCRGEGIGSSLLHKSKEFAFDLGTEKIYVEYMLGDEENQKVQAFFEKNGFETVETGNTLFTFKLSDLRQSARFRKLKELEPLKNTVPMNSLPGAVAENFNRKIGASIPPELAPVNAQGKIIAELSPGYISGGSVAAFVIITSLNGRLYINSAYTDSAHRTHLVKLLGQTLVTAAEKYPQYEEMCVTAANQASMNLIQKLIGEDADKVRKETVRAMRWSLDEELRKAELLSAQAATEVAAKTMDGMEILVPKLMRLMDMLTEENMPCDLMMEFSNIPAVLMDFAGIPATLRYLPADDGFYRFALTVTAFIRSGKTREEMEQICREFNENTIYGTAFRTGDDLCLRYTLPESGLPVSKEQFLDFIDIFRRDLASLAG